MLSKTHCGPPRHHSGCCASIVPSGRCAGATTPPSSSIRERFCVSTRRLFCILADSLLFPVACACSAKHIAGHPSIIAGVVHPYGHQGNVRVPSRRLLAAHVSFSACPHAGFLAHWHIHTFLSHTRMRSKVHSEPPWHHSGCCASTRAPGGCAGAIITLYGRIHTPSTPHPHLRGSRS